MSASDNDRIGAVPHPEGGFGFRVWAPRARRVEVTYPGRRGRRLALSRRERGYFEGIDPAAAPGERYWLRLDGKPAPDPASRSQPMGLRGPSELVDLHLLGEREVRSESVDLSRSVLYELHIGTFSREGTFDGARPRLEALARLGVTAVELLPVGEERGERGWGYGPVFPFAVRRAYGGPQGLRSFVAEAHAARLGVLLDVVYNHWSGEASFLERFGPYFHARASTPWGPTPNVDGPGGDEVRRYFFDNARMWLDEYGVDGFRLDAVHEIYDRSARSFWAEFSELCHSIAAPGERRPVLIGESDLNDVKILRPVAEGGWGLDAQWSDDFHNALHAALTGERSGYYVDFGPLEMLARAFERPFLFEGGFSRYRDRRHGAPSEGAAPDRFVVFDQNHDQVGNRGDGARLTTLLSPGLARVALGLTLFAPYVPMLFMGEEYGETRPFYFFSNPSPPAGRRLAAARWKGIRAQGFTTRPPDPSLRRTFESSRLDPRAPESANGRAYERLVSALLRLRRELPALRSTGTVRASAWEDQRLLSVRRDAQNASALLLANLGSEPRTFRGLSDEDRWIERIRSDGSSPTAPEMSERREFQSGATDGPPVLPGESFVILEGI